MTAPLTVVIILLLLKRSVMLGVFIRQLASNQVIHWFGFEDKSVIFTWVLRLILDLAVIIIYKTQYAYAE